MVSMVERYAAALLGFAFVATAVGAGIGTALLAAAGGAVAYGLAALRQRRRHGRFTEEFLADGAERRRRSRTRRAA